MTNAELIATLRGENYFVTLLHDAADALEAAEKTGVDRRNIFACCQGKKNRLKGYKFDWFCADGERRTDE